MMNTFAALLLSGAFVLAPVDDPGDAPDPGPFSIPNQAIPWSMPALPDMDVDAEDIFTEREAPTFTISHSDNYSSLETQAQELVDGLTFMNSEADELDTVFAGESSIFADPSAAGLLGTDFEVDGSLVTAETMATEAGTRIAYAVEWATALTNEDTLALGSTGFAYAGLFMATLWVIGLTVFKTTLQAIDALISFIFRVIDFLDTFVGKLAALFVGL